MSTASDQPNNPLKEGEEGKKERSRHPHHHGEPPPHQTQASKQASNPSPPHHPPHPTLFTNRTLALPAAAATHRSTAQYPVKYRSVTACLPIPDPAAYLTHV